jgi:membrane associated rhomboid family serine protease
MAAHEYYGSGPSYYDGRVGSPPSNTNKPLPLPHQPTFSTANTGDPHDDLSYASHHYSQQSIDSLYNSHSPDPRHSDPFAVPPTKDYGDAYTENIPLNTTPVAESGQPYPQRRRTHRQRGRSRPKKRPWFCYFLTFVQTAVFIGELARNAVLTKTPIAIKPYFNPMIGPSTFTMIDMGARYVPCMRTIKNVNDDDSFLFACPNTTKTTISTEDGSACDLAESCGFGGQNIPSNLGGTGGKGTQPNQWWRFIVPMFLHAGIIHLAFNMFVQIFLGGDMECEIGIIRFAVVYFTTGIFGFVLGGNLGQTGQPSVGASGCLFGIYALVFLDIFYTWNERPSPVKDLIFLLLDICISFVIGLLPGVDNFAHIGGFISGLALGLAFLHSPNRLRQRIESDSPPYTPAHSSNPYNSSTGDNNLTGAQAFVKQPLGFFKGRKPLWWAWWLVRAAMLAMVLIVFIVLVNNFYKYQKQCHWCRYLSCLPVLNWCSLYDLSPQNTTNTTNNPKMLLARSLGVATGLDAYY